MRLRSRLDGGGVAASSKWERLPSKTSELRIVGSSARRGARGGISPGPMAGTVRRTSPRSVWSADAAASLAGPHVLGGGLSTHEELAFIDLDANDRRAYDVRVGIGKFAAKMS